MSWRSAVRVLLDVVRFVSFGFRSRSQLVAENLFLRKQLALYRERQVKPRRAGDATRMTLVMLPHLIDWRAVLTIVKPNTLPLASHTIPSLLAVEIEDARPTTDTAGRPATDCRRANATWGEERIAAELRLKLGLCVSPRTVRRYTPKGGRPRNGVSSQRWSTFVRNHANAMLACDFFVCITAGFRTLPPGAEARA
jgi:hypothetical protein